jgi:hypothetical protein
LLNLLDLFVSSVLIAVGAKLVQLETVGSGAAIFAGGVARNAWGALVGVCPTFSAFQRDRNAITFLGHFKNSASGFRHSLQLFHRHSKLCKLISQIALSSVKI